MLELKEWKQHIILPTPAIYKSKRSKTHKVLEGGSINCWALVTEQVTDAWWLTQLLSVGKTLLSLLESGAAL